MIADKLGISSFFIPSQKHFLRRQAEQYRLVVDVISHEPDNRHVKIGLGKKKKERK